MDGLLLTPMLWAQTAPDEDVVPILALRRWFWGQTLASPEATPSDVGLWSWLLGLLALLAVAIVAQGPGRALGQLLDIPGQLRLVGSALARVRAASRLLMVALGAAVASWTVSLMARYSRQERLEDLLVLTRSKTVGELAVEQGELAALTPLRDVFSLGDVLVLLLTAAIVVFKYSADRWGPPGATVGPSGKPLPAWTTLCWAAPGVYGLYLMASTLAPTGDLPLGGCLFVEPLVIPALMAVSDGVLAAWVLVELRRADRVGAGGPLDVAGALSLVPAATLAALVALPARYAAMAAYQALPYATGQAAARAVLVPLLSGWGLVYLQAAAVPACGLAGAAAWCRGGWGAAFRGYGRLLKAGGGHLLGLLILAGLAAGVPVGLAYLLVLSLPPQPWVLMAADSYAHYITLPVGLATLAGMVELGRRSSHVSTDVEPPPGPDRRRAEPTSGAAEEATRIGSA